MIELDAYCYQSKSANSDFSADFLKAPATSTELSPAVGM
jgi:hypothetical protein